MIYYTTGDIFESNAQAFINTVNIVGVMGKGIALQFKKAYPNNFKAYLQACKKDEIGMGKLFVCLDTNIESGEKVIINFPTKKHWKSPSEYSYIEEGLIDLVRVIEKYNLESIAMPALGAGNGGLDWQKVKTMIEQKLQSVNIDIFVYEPTNQI